MASISKADMIEATRLTRQGLLKEAMAVLRGEGHSAGSSVPPSPGQEPFAGFPGFRRSRTRDVGDLARPLPDGARFDNVAFRRGSGSRSYKLYIPASGGEGPRPLLIMLHGCTQSPDDFARGTRMNELAEEHGFIVAYPEQIQSANSSKCWNWFKPNDQHRDSGEPALIAGITREIMADLAVDGRQVFVAGLSAGGATAAIMGATYPELFAGIGVHSGLPCGAATDMNTAFAAMRQGAQGSGALPMPVPTIVFHGDRDATVSPANGDAVVAQVAGRRSLTSTTSEGVSVGGVPYTRTAWTDIDGRPALEHWQIHGSGHAWSGGNAAGTYTDPRGPDASREMVRFFLSLAR